MSKVEITPKPSDLHHLLDGLDREGLSHVLARTQSLRNAPSDSVRFVLIADAAETDTHLVLYGDGTWRLTTKIDFPPKD